jgi:hypothetical protein
MERELIENKQQEEQEEEESQITCDQYGNIYFDMNDQEFSNLLTVMLFSFLIII